MSPRNQTVVWLFLGGAAAAALLDRWPLHDHGLSRGVLLLFGLVSVLASVIEIPTQLPRMGRDVQDTMACNEAALVLFLLTVPPSWAWFLLLGGYVATNVARHRSLLRNAFNLGTWATSVALAVVVFEALAPAAPGLTLRSAVAAAAAVAVHGVVNYVAVETVVAASTGVPWRARANATIALALLSTAGNTTLGLTMAALWQVDPWLSPVAAGIALLLRTAYRQVLVAAELADDVRVERDRLQVVVSGTSDGTVLLDHASRITIWSRTVEAWTGIPASEALGHPVDEVLAPLADTVDEAPPPVLGAAVLTGIAADERLWLRHRDGERRLLTVRHALQRDRLERVVADVVQLHDLTREHEVERLKDDFLSRVSHELRTPLTAILGYARTLTAHRDRLGAATAAEMEDRIVARAEQLEALVDDLLLVASVEPPTPAPGTELTTQELLPLVEAATEAEQRRQPGRTVTVSAHGHAAADVHPTWLSTAVRYLVANALQYSPVDAAVEVEVAETDDGATITVTDHGRGIPASKLTEIFDRFTRLEDPLLMETGGTGVGLYVVARLVRRLGGRVTVTSGVGRGSKFVVHLPPARVPAEPPLVEAA